MVLILHSFAASITIRFTSIKLFTPFPSISKY
nr:MAG TPA: hypothetical protein [Caudoviricetes sp.]